VARKDYSIELKRLTIEGIAADHESVDNAWKTITLFIRYWRDNAYLYEDRREMSRNDLEDAYASASATATLLMQGLVLYAESGSGAAITALAKQGGRSWATKNPKAIAMREIEREWKRRKKAGERFRAIDFSREMARKYPCTQESISNAQTRWGKSFHSSGPM
jgi:hypothetical protein